MTHTESAPVFRLAYVPGVTPGKWVRTWQERLPDVPLELGPVSADEAAAALLDGRADAGLVRLPVDRTRLSAIPLYTETTVAVVPKDHWLAAADEIELADLADEIVLHPQDDTLGWQQLPGKPARERPAGTGDAVQLVAAGIGVLLVPQSLARLHHRRDLTYRPLTGAPQSAVALSWPEGRTTDLVEEFIGIVRGRTVNSSRGRRPAPEQAGRKAESPKARQPKAQQRSGRSAQPGGASAAARRQAGGGAAAARRRGRPRRGA